jgi:DNA-binding PadR family transcriptional regulator
MPADHWSREGHGRPGGKRSKGGRLFDYGDFRHVVLTLLAEQPRHGYDIIRAIDQRTGGTYCPSPGVVYPTLSLLEDIGHARVLVGDGARNRYEITADGRAFLRGNKRQIDGILSRMQHLGSAHAGASPVIVAAMDNLKAALRGGARPWSASEAQAVAAAIDSAAELIRGLRQEAGQALEDAMSKRNVGETR